ncbi:hypothetical protein KAR91_73245 [Candidatus Pacearchaeota archaeon]|nr:hypothetical protein [Candidatus Pacearchaeota archaeon]
MKNYDKKNIDLDVLNLINSFVEVNSLKDCVVYLRGDAEFDNAVLVIKGNAALVANTIIHHIEKNPGFKQLMFATIGSYLSKNPDVEKEFLNGIEGVKNNFGEN